MTTINNLQQFVEEKKQRTTRLMGAPSEWERLQRQTFKNWLNAVLAPRGHSVQSLEEDLSDGRLLIAVMELLYDTDGVFIDHRRARPVSSAQQDSSHLRIDAVHSVFKFMRTHLKMTVSLAPEAIVQGESKTIMRLIWELIQKREISDRKLTRNLLLAWARDRVARTDPGAEVKNFSNSFQEPRVWAALINSFRPQLYDTAQLSQKPSAEVLRELFEIAEKELHVPQLLDVALVDVSSDWPPDERSILTYLVMFLKLDEQYPQQTLRELQQQGRVSRVNSPILSGHSESVKQSPVSSPSMVRVLSNKRLKMKRDGSSPRLSPASSPRTVHIDQLTHATSDIPPPPPAPLVTVEPVDEPSEPINSPEPTAVIEPKIETPIEPTPNIETESPSEQIPIPQLIVVPVNLSQPKEELPDSAPQSESQPTSLSESVPNKETDSVNSAPKSVESDQLTTSETKSSEAAERDIQPISSLSETAPRATDKNSSKDSSPNEKHKHKSRKRRESLKHSQSSVTTETDTRMAVSQSDSVLPSTAEESAEDDTNTNSKSGKNFLGKIRRAFRQAMDDMHVTRHHDDDESKKRPHSARPKSMREISTSNEKKSRSPLAAFVDLFKPSSRKEKSRSMSLDKESKSKKKLQRTKSGLTQSLNASEPSSEDLQRARSTSVAPEELKEASRMRHQSLPASAMTKSGSVAAAAKKGPVIKPMKDIKRPLDFGLTRFNGVQSVLLDQDAVKAYNEHLQNNTNQLKTSGSNNSLTSPKYRLDPELLEHYMTNIKRVTLMQSLIKTRAARGRFEQLLKRSIIAREILKSESSYVDSLTKIIKLFKVPLTQFAANSGDKNRSVQISAADIKVIFSEIDVILNYNQMMQTQLTERVSKWNAEQRLGDIFLGMIEFMKVYTQYVKNFNDALKTLSMYRQNKIFRDWLQEVRNNPESSNLTISDFLIMPVQRIPRYVMLLEDLLQTTPRSHKDYRDVQLAVEKMSQICQYVNEKKRDAENLDLVLQVQDRLRFKEKRIDVNGLKARNLSEAHRRYIKEGYLTVYHNPEETDSSKRRYCIVFNDLVLETKLNSKRKRKKSIALNPEQPAPDSGDQMALNRAQTDKLYFVREMPISFDSVVMESKAVPFGFSLRTKDAHNLFSAESKEEQEEWIMLIKRNLAQLIKNKLSQELELMKKI